MSLRHLPNLISLLRLLMAMPIAWFLGHEEYERAVLLFAAAGASDGIDGWLARRYHWQSRLGGLLDPLADKVMMAAAFLALAWSGAIPLWLAAAVLGRDLVIVTGALVYHLLVGGLEAAPRPASKVNTAIQVLYVLGVLAERWGGLELAAGLEVFAWVVLATTVISGLEYVLRWGRKAWREGLR